MKSLERIISLDVLARLSDHARAAQRKRQNLNLHQSADEPCQRLLNAMEPGSYVRPHRHVKPPKPECFLVLRGSLVVAVFDDAGALLRVFKLSPRGPNFGVDIPPGVWHSAVALESGTVFFETKPGPYRPLTDKDWAPWAPAEDDPRAGAYLSRLVDKVRALPVPAKA